ncbi:hypothetical protein [Burkholderia orbicola]|uniref:hypothetical protein n=1 Tax=Burkholderia orbicola TaxID=2978683 RepID=UPI002FDF288E
MSIDVNKINVAAPTEAERRDPGVTEKAAAEAAFFSKPAAANDEYEEMDLKERQHTLDLRIEYASKAYAFVKGSVAALFSVIAAVIFLNTLFNAVVGPALGIKDFVALSDKVLIALISGVTVNVLAVFLVVVRNLFPASLNEAKNGKKSVTGKSNLKKDVKKAVKSTVDKSASSREPKPEDTSAAPMKEQREAAG